MKKLLLIFLVFISFASYGQRIQKANTYGLAFNRTGADTLFYLPSDTFTVPAAYLTYPFMARKGANVYIWNTSSNVWQGLTGGTLDTTGAFITSVYRRSDSVFYVKGGVHTFAFKDSTGGSTPTLQQVLTAGSNLTTDHTIDFGGNDFILKGDSIIIKDPSGNERITFAPNGNPGEGDATRIRLINGDGAKMLIQAGDQYLETHSGWYIRNTLQGGNVALSLNTYVGQSASIMDILHDSEKIFDIAVDSFSFRPPLGKLYIDTLNYTLSTTGKKILIRDTVTGLVQNIDPSLLGASSYTFTNGITESGGTVKLGGTLTETTTINTNTNELAIQSNSSGDRGTIFFNGAGQVEFSASSNVDNSTIRVVIDSLQFEPKAGRMNIDTLAAASNMTNKRVMTWDTVTKRWEQISKDSVGGTGGTTSPAGNYGNLQLNRNGAFATPASDSLDFTTGLDIKGHVNVSATSTTGIQFGGTTRIYNDGTRMRISPSGGEVQFYTAGTGNLISVINSGGSNSVVMNGQTGQIYRSSDGLQIQTTGNVGIGSGVGTTSTARLHISAGTATASSAPFKLTSGTNLTTPEAGAMEYNGTNLFFTPSSAARNNILMTASVNSVSPTSPNRTITIVVDGVTLYLHAKTTND